MKPPLHSERGSLWGLNEVHKMLSLGALGPCGPGAKEKLRAQLTREFGIDPCSAAVRNAPKDVQVSEGEVHAASTAALGVSTELYGARARSLARRQLDRASELLSETPSAGDVSGDCDEPLAPSAVQAEANIMSAVDLLRGLPLAEQSPTLLAEAALQMANTTGTRAQTAERAAAQLESVLATEGFERSAGATGAEVRQALSEVRSRVPMQEELRACKVCGEQKPRSAYSGENQWRNGKKRRCLDCQASGSTAAAVAQRQEEAAAAQEAADFRRIHEEAAARERARIEEELARRNANEHQESECTICFDDCAPADRVTLHGEQHWTCKQCLAQLLDKLGRPLKCPSCREPLDEERLRAMT